jgi:nitroreductase/FMN reductase [NAD(P)H]
MLFACAQSASSKSDLQQYSIIRVKDAEKLNTIAQLIPDMPWIALAPVFLVFCGDIRRGQKISRLRGYANVNNTLDSFMNSAVDAALAMQTFVLAAEACGLGCCPISAVRVRIEEIAAHLELPDGVFPMCGLCVGYPASEGHLTMRLPPTVIVHTDRYDDSALEAELTAYDARRESHFPTTPARQLYVERFGVSGQYGWSEHAARRLTVREREHFKPYLEAHGFELD